MSGRKYEQGFFHPINKEKYGGKLDNIRYKSSWELRFMNICDKSNKIRKWSYEPFSIFYISPLDKKQHRYFPDFWVQVWDDEETKLKYNNVLIEIKPHAQTQKPILVEGKKYSQKRMLNHFEEIKTYIINIKKWESALQFCQVNGFEFKILTEKTLNIFK